jgi:hypothetical protein
MTSHVSPSATNEQGGTAEEGPVRWQRASERRRRGQAPAAEAGHVGSENLARRIWYCLA